MRKANSLRDWLTRCLPEDFRDHPDRLEVFLQGGQISARAGRNLSFVYNYTIKLFVGEFTGNTDRLVVPILAWIEKEQPQLLKRQDSQPFSFEAEILDSETSDIEVSIDLTEDVRVTPRPDGTGYDLDHLPEPNFSDAFEGVSAKFSQGFAAVELAIEADAADAETTSP